MCSHGRRLNSPCHFCPATKRTFCFRDHPATFHQRQQPWELQPLLLSVPSPVTSPRAVRRWSPTNDWLTRVPLSQPNVGHRRGNPDLLRQTSAGTAGLRATALTRKRQAYTLCPRNKSVGCAHDGKPRWHGDGWRVGSCCWPERAQGCSVHKCLVRSAAWLWRLMLNPDGQACQAETSQADDAREDKNYPPRDSEDR